MIISIGNLEIIVAVSVEGCTFQIQSFDVRTLNIPVSKILKMMVIKHFHYRLFK